jgi:hypothetical protein
MATAVDCISSRRSLSAPKIMMAEFHWHLCACGAVVFCPNDPC